MRGVLVAAAMVLAAAGCSGIEPGKVYPPDVLADAADVAGEPGTDLGGPDAYADAGPRMDAPPGDEGVGPETGPGVLRHFGWFGPGGVGFGGGVSAFWSACGPRQAWRVQ